MSTLHGIPLVNDDPAFLAIGDLFECIRQERLDEMRRTYGIQGHNELGGDIRPDLGLCNLSYSNMFDGKQPEIGDIVAIGYLYGESEAEALVGRLAVDHGRYEDWPACPRLGDMYRFRWGLEEIARHAFPSRRAARC